MHYGIIAEWRRRTAIYQEDTKEFVSIDEKKDYTISFGDDDVMSNPNYTGQTVPALDIAEQFATLYKANTSKEIFVENVVKFISKYGMMGINRGRKGSIPYKETFMDWVKETKEMSEVLKWLNYLKENPPLFKEDNNLNNSQDIPNEACSMNYSPEYRKQLDNSPFGALFKIQNIINKHLTGVNPYLILDCKDNDAFLRPMMEFHNLLGSMYFAIFQNLQGKILICVKCGTPFFTNPRKESKNTKDLCKGCIEKNRNKRRNAARVNEEYKKIAWNIEQRINNNSSPFSVKSIPPDKKEDLKRWHNKFKAEYNKKTPGKGQILTKKQTEKLEAWVKRKEEELDAKIKSFKGRFN